MSQHSATVTWQRDGDEKFTDNRYSRRHEWRFDGGAVVVGSASPTVVPVPMSDPAGVDPEEAFIASLSSCHMLWFLAIAAKRGFVVDRYTDAATGVLGKTAEGRTAMTGVTLHPRVEFAGERRPTGEDLTAMHHEAHEKCFIANSVKTVVACEPA